MASLTTPDNPGRNEPGKGETNYDFLFRRLDEIGYDGWIGCEYKPRTTTLEDVEAVLAKSFVVTGEMELMSTTVLPGFRPLATPRAARSGPHKSLGVERRFLNQASRTPFDCQAISSSPSRKHLLTDRRLASDRPTLRCHRHSCGDKPFSTAQDCPGDPRQLVGEGDDRDIMMGPRH